MSIRFAALVSVIGLLATACRPMEVYIETRVPSTTSHQPTLAPALTFATLALTAATPEQTTPLITEIIPTTITPSATESAPARLSASSEWAVFFNEIYSLQFQYPAHWVQDRDYSRAYHGSDGFFELSATNSQANLLTNTCQDLVNSGGYGSSPTLETLTIDGQEACLILPSADQSPDAHHQAALAVRFPQLMSNIVSGVEYAFFILWADDQHIRPMANTLHFLPLANATPTPAGHSPSDVAITTFTVAQTTINPGDAVTVSWSSRYAVNARLEERIETESGAVATVRRWDDLPPNGQLVLTTTLDDRDTHLLALFVSDGLNREAVGNLTLSFTCPYTYFFSPTPATCPDGDAQAHSIVEQSFTGGRMVWVEDADPMGANVYVLFAEGVAWKVFDRWTPDQPVSDPTLQPPEGTYQPERGFGLVWRENLEVQTKLGWAIAPEQMYTNQYQVDSRPYQADLILYRPRLVYLRLGDGLIIRITDYGTRQTWVALSP